MNRNQNETEQGGRWKAEGGMKKRRGYAAQTIRNQNSAIRDPHSAFTLTELLVVITIIAILASLITGAAINALNRAKQAAITLEIQQLDGSLEDFKNTFGAYPPNGMFPTGVQDNSGTLVGALHETDFALMLRKAFPRQDASERDILVRKLVGDITVGGTPDAGGYLTEGMRGCEALVFWLGGFSADTQFPISGPGGPSYRIDVATPIEDITTRNGRYDFDLGRLGPRDANGKFHDSDNLGFGRYVTYQVTINGVDQTRRINFWQYTPSGSVWPIVYFDASRHRAQVQDNAGNFLNNYDPWFYRHAQSNVFRYAPKRFNETGGSNRIEFVNQGKFLLLHCGIDDIWGDFGETSMWIGAPGDPVNTTLKRFPTGPFLNDVADTVGNFMTGTLADEQE